ncbi:MAG: protein-L-isoaspartate(D-aspartate) O-methyltransferase [Deltaproteobacteria bacterium]|nr:protein-L-isoaspartate(D-aspartate) O-methyltransferase [Candidatus Anaeroferrophillus wilburensis]MBN2889597.1 protein-L-isoaspartate(D-aspartate) O-methyltransferase [Deltaproteobacteria bacterium]
MDNEHLRREMVNRQLITRGIRDPLVLEAMGTVERHRFVPHRLQQAAYADHPLPIGKGQTISQPYMVAAMTEQLALSKSKKVLEIGTGSGYQTAILAYLAARVISLELHPELAEQAQKTLAEIGYHNITIIIADGTLGYEAQAPYDAIMVTAGAPHIPQALTEQLTDSGRLVIPVGSRGYQMLTLITKTGGKLITEELFLCSFVPLVGNNGWQAG